MFKNEYISMKEIEDDHFDHPFFRALIYIVSP